MPRGKAYVLVARPGKTTVTCRCAFPPCVCHCKQGRGAVGCDGAVETQPTRALGTACLSPFLNPLRRSQDVLPCLANKISVCLNGSG